MKKSSVLDGGDTFWVVFLSAFDSLSAFLCLDCEVAEYVQERLRSRQR